jgi:PiT family inorganic phosphate transporter
LETGFVLLGVTIFLGLLFEFTNGFHDTANVVSTVIATKVLRPVIAIIMASLLNTLGATQTSQVVKTLTTGLLPANQLSQLVIISSLLGAIMWNLVTWYLAIPSSSSYALIGGLLGAGIASVGIESVYWSSFIKKVFIPMCLSPITGFVLSLGLMKIGSFFLRSSYSWPIFGRLQILSAAFVAIAHGFNDAQKTMAILTLGLFTAGKIHTLQIPFEVIIICALVMGLGTGIGGFRIIRTLAYKITPLKPIQGFVAESSSSILIFTASYFGFPLSTTHLIAGSVIGVGAAQGFSKVSWKTASRIMYAKILTFPGAGLVAWITYQILNV